ncbi:indole-3-glycerol phosphate synthase TrpC [Dermatobacter hominis]|uniref:indole-3-glycerol phosphate synthase TrpC n=1 Tax=Dermatobacter hominis TaxID=2884263 RepID=UPI001D12368C|nr:indole-3-glycerol phosphate synthase TrpC [Dermatobacter hominis]UDY36042.1 indole-3-glycerol phosphate synthase TrpC [Dermatobacter hominis]
MATYLDAIVARHRSDAAQDARSTDELVEVARELPPGRGFRASLAASTELAVISEVKRRSPSKGDLFVDLDPAALAADYQAAGATCLSVLTDTESFGGSTDDLVAARTAVELPVLRKDFTVSANDVCDARLMGADCVLLIVAALDDAELRDFAALSGEIGLDVLVEVHDEAELERALATTAGDLVGVNQRDLVTFEVDQARAVRMAGVMPADTIRVAESGVRGRDDAVALAEAGYHAVLVGEHLVTAADPVAALAELRVPLA